LERPAPDDRTHHELSADRDTPTRLAARVKLRSSATARKAARTFKSSSCVGEWYSHPHADLTNFSTPRPTAML
jgi:hypothetical protein